jgi:hypothetical protein
MNFRHVLNTWILSHVFHPLLFCLSMMGIGESVPMGALPLVIVAVPIASIPSLLFSWFFLHCLRFNNKAIVVTQGLWLLLVPVAILLNMLLFLVLVGGSYTLFEEPAYILPSIVASWIAILARTQQFQNLFIYKSSDNENSLV